MFSHGCNWKIWCSGKKIAFGSFPDFNFVSAHVACQRTKSGVLKNHPVLGCTMADDWHTDFSLSPSTYNVYTVRPSYLIENSRSLLFVWFRVGFTIFSSYWLTVGMRMSVTMYIFKDRYQVGASLHMLSWKLRTHQFATAPSDRSEMSPGCFYDRH